MKNFLQISSIVFIVIMSSCYSDSSISGDTVNIGQGGSLARFTISHNHLYTLDDAQLHVYEVTEASNPVSKSSSDYYSGLETIFSKDNYLYIGTQTGMMIFDLSNPEQPDIISTYEHVFSCDPVVVKDNYAFITLNSENFWCGRGVNELQVIDISNKHSPEKELTLQMDMPKGLGVKDSLLFVCDDGLEVYNMDNLPQLSFVESFNISATDVIPTNDYLIVIGDDALRQYNYDNGSLTFLSEINFDKN